MEKRVAALADRCHCEPAKAAAINTEWMMFYHPFFQGIFRVDGTELAPARAAAALALASAALSAGGAAPAAVPPCTAAAVPRPADSARTAHSRRALPRPYGPSAPAARASAGRRCRVGGSNKPSTPNSFSTSAW